MTAKQDRVRARTPTDIERKYGIRKSFSELAGIANDARNRIGRVESNIESGTWKPTLNMEDIPYTVQQGWYQKVGKVVTIGWLIEAEIPDSVITIPLGISGVPYIPLYDAFGGGVYMRDDSAVAGWVVDGNGVITTSPTSMYPFSGAIKLSGTICYTT